MNKLYRRTSGFVKRYKLVLVADILVLLTTSHFLIRRMSGFSIFEWLRSNVLRDAVADNLVVFAGALLVLAILFKVLALVWEYIPVFNHENVEPEEISACLFHMNSEISRHIKQCDSGQTPYLRKLFEQHTFDVNTRLVVDSLAGHICRAINVIKIKKKDVFISLYSFDEASDSLSYELHCDSRRDMVKSKQISLSSDEYRGYQCVMCMLSGDTTSYVLEKSQYAKGMDKRHKTVCHYMGCKLADGDRVFGFLNIEFHNHVIFLSEEEMQDFMEENIFPFKLLIEYQYLKREFFNRFKDLESHWKVANS